MCANMFLTKKTIGVWTMTMRPDFSGIFFVTIVISWIDGKKNGHFILIDEENEVWTINYVNDKIALNNSSLKGNDKNKKALINQELFFQYWSNYEEKPLKKSKTIIIRKMK